MNFFSSCRASRPDYFLPRFAFLAAFVAILLLTSPRLYAQTAPVYQINCGAPAPPAGVAVNTGFQYDAYASGGSKYPASGGTISHTIDTSGVANAAPENVYQNERTGTSFSYTFPNLQQTVQCMVRLHFAEYEYSAIGKRTFNVSINGQTVLPDFDVYKEAGAKYKAVVESFPATPDSSGKITISFASVAKSAEIKGIEILGQRIDFALTGTAKDSKGNDNILVGQQCTGELTGTPDDSNWPKKITYSWTVSGITFQSWKAGNPASSFNTNSIPSTKLTSWYWNDVLASDTSTAETVSCTVAGTPPNGQGSPFTVTVTKKVTVWEPTWTAKAIGGTMKVSKYPFTPKGGNPDDYWLWASPAADSGENAGMGWYCTVTSPNTALFGDGTIEIEQILIPKRFYTASNGSAHWSINGLTGSDAPFPYGWSTTAPNYFAGDTPGSDLEDPSDLISQTDQDSFKDYLMYLPPGSVQYVPLATFMWSTNGSATIPKSNNWADYNGSPGSVTPSGTKPFTHIESGTDFPEWTRVNSEKALYDPD